MPKTVELALHRSVGVRTLLFVHCREISLETFVWRGYDHLYKWGKMSLCSRSADAWVPTFERVSRSGRSRWETRLDNIVDPVPFSGLKQCKSVAEPRPQGCASTPISKPPMTITTVGSRTKVDHSLDEPYDTDLIAGDDNDAEDTLSSVDCSYYMGEKVTSR